MRLPEPPTRAAAPGGHDEAAHPDHGNAGHAHPMSADADRRWLRAALGVLVIFMVFEVCAGVFAHSLALITDAGHLLTDVASLVVALVAVRLAARPARGAYTYGFARVDALAGQANGITLILLAVWFAVEAVGRLIDPPHPTGLVMTLVALVGVAANLLATAFAARADPRRQSVRGAVAHLVNDLWAFAATAAAGLVIVFTGWARADPVASLVVAALMAYTGGSLLRAAGRVFLEAAPRGLDPSELGAELARVAGVAEVHDLHVWQLGPGESAVSAHVLVSPPHDCHSIGEQLRDLLSERHGLGHATLQLDHVGPGLDGEHGSMHQCSDPHGPVHSAPAHETRATGRRDGPSSAP
jgi:cobalt-zinc-cadmium efflux system protein